MQISQIFLLENFLVQLGNFIKQIIFAFFSMNLKNEYFVKLLLQKPNSTLE